LLRLRAQLYWLMFWGFPFAGCLLRISPDISRSWTSCTSARTTGWPNRRCIRSSRGGQCWPGDGGGADITLAVVPDTRKRRPWIPSSTSAYLGLRATSVTWSCPSCSNTKPIRKPKGHGPCSPLVLRSTKCLILLPGWRRSSWHNR